MLEMFMQHRFLEKRDAEIANAAGTVSHARCLPLGCPRTAQVVSVAQLARLASVDILDDLRLLFILVFSFFGSMVVAACVAFALDERERRRAIDRMKSADCGFSLPGGDVWLWRWPQETFAGEVGRLRGAAVRAAQVVGLPWVRLRCAVPEEFLSGTVAEAVGRKRGLAPGRAGGGGLRRSQTGGAGFASAATQSRSSSARSIRLSQQPAGLGVRRRSADESGAKSESSAMQAAAQSLHEVAAASAGSKSRRRHSSEGAAAEGAPPLRTGTSSSAEPGLDAATTQLRRGSTGSRFSVLGMSLLVGASGLQAGPEQVPTAEHYWPSAVSGGGRLKWGQHSSKPRSLAASRRGAKRRSEESAPAPPHHGVVTLDHMTSTAFMLAFVATASLIPGKELVQRYEATAR